MSLVEGSGIFKCHHGHKTEFVTQDINAYNKHLSDGKHTEFGSKECAICNKQGPNEEHVIGKNYVCPDCKKEIAKNA